MISPVARFATYTAIGLFIVSVALSAVDIALSEPGVWQLNQGKKCEIA